MFPERTLQLMGWKVPDQSNALMVFIQVQDRFICFNFWIHEWICKK